MSTEPDPLRDLPWQDDFRAAMPDAVVVDVATLQGGQFCTAARVVVVDADGTAALVVRQVPEAYAALVARTVALLRELADRPVPVPAVVAASGRVMVVSWIHGEVCPVGQGTDEEIDGACEVLGAIRSFGFPPVEGVPQFPSSPSPGWRRRIEASALGRAALARLDGMTPSTIERLVHGDLWSGNLIWADGRVAAVIDWDRASIGSPGIDLASYALDILIRRGPAARDRLIAEHLEHCGSIADLGFWELRMAASAYADEGSLLRQGYEAIGTAPAILDSIPDRLGTEIERLLSSPDSGRTG